MKINFENIQHDRTVVSTFGTIMLFVAIGGYFAPGLVWVWFTIGTCFGLFVTLRNQGVI